MGQEEVVDVLRKSEFPLSLAELMKTLEEYGMGRISIHQALQKLIKHQEVMYLELDRLLAKKFYGAKKKVRLYYLPK